MGIILIYASYAETRTWCSYSEEDI